MKLLVFGAGQLAQMMYLAGIPLGVQVQAVDVNTGNVVHPVSKQDMNKKLQDAFDEAAAITAEFEHVPEDLLLQAEETGKLLPSSATILTGADRVREKLLLNKAGVLTADYVVIDDLIKIQDCINTLGERIIFKASRDGYDGYGQWRVSDRQQMSALEETFSTLDLKSVPILAEKMIDFDRELSVIGARKANGESHIFSMAENLHHQGQLQVSIAPAPDLTEELQLLAESIFVKIADALDYVGVLAVELFQVDGRLLVNEIAPRVHNSGHWTQNGAETSQFEQHIRAVLDLPLGDSQVNRPTVMINIIGCTSFSRELISIPGCHLHWYGKSVREKRKMGHINITADSFAELGEKVGKLITYLPVEHFPLVSKQVSRLKTL